MDDGLVMMYIHRTGTPSFVALGQVLRALGRGWRVCIIQFSHGPGSLGEVAGSRHLDAALECRLLGSGGTHSGKDEASEVAEAWQAARKAVESDAYQLVVLDELTKPLSRGLLDLDQVVQFLAHRRTHVNILITGPDPPQPLVEAADLVTDVLDTTPRSQPPVA